VSKQAKRDRQRQNREVRRQYEQTVARRRKTFKTVRNFAILAVPVLVLGIVLSVSNGSSGSAPSANIQYATLTTSLGDIVVQLSGSEAPKSEAQFIRLAKKGFYDGLTFHRVSKSTGIIQGGDPKGNGTGGSGKTVADEYPTSAYKIGDLAFANSGRPNTSDSQFFFVTSKPGTGLPMTYNRFGHIIRGLDIAQEIEALSPASGDGPPTHTVSLVKVVITKKAPPAAPNVTGSTTTAPSTTSTT